MHLRHADPETVVHIFCAVLHKYAHPRARRCSATSRATPTTKHHLSARYRMLKMNFDSHRSHHPIHSRLFAAHPPELPMTTPQNLYSTITTSDGALHQRREPQLRQHEQAGSYPLPHVSPSSTHTCLCATKQACAAFTATKCGKTQRKHTTSAHVSTTRRLCRHRQPVQHEATKPDYTEQQKRATSKVISVPRHRLGAHKARRPLAWHATRCEPELRQQSHPIPYSLTQVGTSSHSCLFATKHPPPKIKPPTIFTPTSCEKQNRQCSLAEATRTPCSLSMQVGAFVDAGCTLGGSPPAA